MHSLLLRQFRSFSAYFRFMLIAKLTPYAHIFDKIYLKYIFLFNLKCITICFFFKIKLNCNRFIKRIIFWFNKSLYTTKNVIWLIHSRRSIHSYNWSYELIYISIDRPLNQSIERIKSGKKVRSRKLILKNIFVFKKLHNS